jgi:hypothetical protein
MACFREQNKIDLITAFFDSLEVIPDRSLCHNLVFGSLDQDLKYAPWQKLLR